MALAAAAADSEAHTLPDAAPEMEKTSIDVASLRSRDRRRVARHGVDAVAAAAAGIAARGSAGESSHDAAMDSAGKSYHAMALQNKISRESKSWENRTVTAGPDGGAASACVKFNAQGISYQVDVRRMEQKDASTGQTLKVQRGKNGRWLLKKSSQKSGGWTAYPSEFSIRFEEAYTNLMKSQEPTDGPKEIDVAPAWSFEELVAREEGLPEGGMAPSEVEEASKAVLKAAAEEPRRAPAIARFLLQLSRRQGLRCGAAEARHAGLVVGSMSLLQAVSASNPSMQLYGFEVFDQKYAGIKLNEDGRKNGIRCLLARGMCPGAHAPSSKLLKKIEADSAPLWQARFSEALDRAFHVLPDQVLERIRVFLFTAPRG